MFTATTYAGPSAPTAIVNPCRSASLRQRICCLPSLGNLVWTVLLITALGLFSPIHAEDGSTLLKLSASAEGEFPNDLMTVLLVVERRTTHLDEAVTAAQRMMQRALVQVAATPGVEARSLGYSTSPLHDRDRSLTEPVGWRVRQSLELKSMDFVKLTQLVGALQQEDLLVEQIHFSLSPAARAHHHDHLLQQAIQTWRQTAQEMAFALGASHLFPKELSLQDEGPIFAPRTLMAMESGALRSSGPALESGNSSLRVTVSGEMRAYGANTLRSQDRR